VDDAEAKNVTAKENHVEEKSTQDVKPSLLSVHRCVACGTIRRREDVAEDELITGVLMCRQCGFSGPLSVTVIEDEQTAC
jgi:predicted RNA-binding Zn-ribbon protein involved in translation (DUF1610 family)